jgi:hypothetical protein
MTGRFEDYRHYYSGEVFNDLVAIESPGDEEIKRFPVGLNLVKMLAQAQADALVGEWDERILSFVPAADETGEEDRKSSQAAQQLVADILRPPTPTRLFWQAALTREVYGGVPLMVKAVTTYHLHQVGSRCPWKAFTRSGTRTTRTRSSRPTS